MSALSSKDVQRMLDVAIAKAEQIGAPMNIAILDSDSVLHITLPARVFTSPSSALIPADGSP